MYSFVTNGCFLTSFFLVRFFKFFKVFHHFKLILNFTFLFYICKYLRFKDYFEIKTVIRASNETVPWFNACFKKLKNVCLCRRTFVYIEERLFKSKNTWFIAKNNCRTKDQLLYQRILSISNCVIESMRFGNSVWTVWHSVNNTFFIVTSWWWCDIHSVRCF